MTATEIQLKVIFMKGAEKRTTISYENVIKFCSVFKGHYMLYVKKPSNLNY